MDIKSKLNATIGVEHYDEANLFYILQDRIKMCIPIYGMVNLSDSTYPYFYTISHDLDIHVSINHVDQPLEDNISLFLLHTTEAFLEKSSTS